MSNIELTSKIENIKTLQTMIDELTAEMEAVKDEVKAEMNAKGVDEMTVSCFKVHIQNYYCSESFTYASFGICN